MAVEECPTAKRARGFNDLYDVTPELKNPRAAIVETIEVDEEMRDMEMYLS
jgi:hypothetical protein